MAEDTLSKQFRIRPEPLASECGKLYSFIDTSLEALPVSNEFRQDFKLIIEELFANIIKHAYSRDADNKEIIFDLNISDCSVELVARDRGPEFNPLLHGGMSEDTDLSMGGMGIHLIKSVSDAQEYSRVENYNIFRVRKDFGNNS